MKKLRDPRIEEFLKEGVRQSIKYFAPTKKDFVKIASKNSENSLAASLVNIRQLTLEPFTVIPAHADPGQEMVLMPKHGHAEVIVWDIAFGEQPKAFKLNMGEGPVVVPPAYSCAIRTFANTVTFYIIACALPGMHMLSSADNRKDLRSRVMWQKGARKLCKNKHHSAH